MANNAKQLRGQIRQLVKDLIPEILGTELAKSIHAQLQALISAQLSTLTAEVRQSLKAMDERSKDIQSYMIRNNPPTKQ